MFPEVKIFSFIFYKLYRFCMTYSVNFCALCLTVSKFIFSYGRPVVPVSFSSPLNCREMFVKSQSTMYVKNFLKI